MFGWWWIWEASWSIMKLWTRPAKFSMASSNACAPKVLMLFLLGPLLGSVTDFLIVLTGGAGSCGSMFRLYTCLPDFEQTHSGFWNDLWHWGLRPVKKKAWTEGICRIFPAQIPWVSESRWRHGVPEVFDCPFCLESCWRIGPRRLCLCWDLRWQRWLRPGSDGGCWWWENLFDWGISCRRWLPCRPLGCCQTLCQRCQARICVEEVWLPHRLLFHGTNGPHCIYRKCWLPNRVVQHRDGRRTQTSGSSVGRCECGDVGLIQLSRHSWVLRTYQGQQGGIVGENCPAYQLAASTSTIGRLQHCFWQCHNHHDSHYHHGHWWRWRVCKPCYWNWKRHPWSLHGFGHRLERFWSTWSVAFRTTQTSFFFPRLETAQLCSAPFAQNIPQFTSIYCIYWSRFVPASLRGSMFWHLESPETVLPVSSSLPCWIFTVLAKHVGLWTKKPLAGRRCDAALVLLGRFFVAVWYRAC